jgi:hypothetical protein
VGRRAILVSALGLACLPSAGQDEAALKAALEGRRVVVRVDMPASHKGIDLRFDRAQPFDLQENLSRVREHDLALREGDRGTITFVKVKDDLIEVHLDGGGFNWITDTTTRTFSSTSKSSREKDLEDRIKREADRDRRRDMQDELDDLRRDREYSDDRRRREVEDHNRWARDRDLDRARRSGSRFNLRFRKQVPPDALTPEGVAARLQPFLALGRDLPRTGAAPGRAGPGGAAGFLRKGLLREEVEARLGEPLEVRERREGDLRHAVLVFADGPEEIEATFVEDVLVRVRPR